MHPFRATSYWVSKQHFSKCWDVFKSHLRISCTSFFVCVYFFFWAEKFSSASFYIIFITPKEKQVKMSTTIATVRWRCYG